MKYTPTDNPNYSRESGSGALINNNVSELQLLKMQRKKIVDQNNELKDLKQQLEELKNLILRGRE